MGICAQVFAIILFSIALIINVVAIATPGWIYSSAASAGLFEVFASGLTATLLRSAAENTAFAFCLIADVFLIVAIVGAAIATIKDGVGGMLGGIMGIIAAVFFLIGMSTYTGIKLADLNFSALLFGYSFALGWSSCGLSLIGGIVSLLG